MNIVIQKCQDWACGCEMAIQYLVVEDHSQMIVHLGFPARKGMYLKGRGREIEVRTKKVVGF